jgi:hypothetical protein
MLLVRNQCEAGCEAALASKAQAEANLEIGIPYSARSATIGSTFAARLAGSQDAPNATANRRLALRVAEAN